MAGPVRAISGTRMKMFFCVLMMLHAGTAAAASFDCTRAATTVEKVICRDDALSRLDDQMTVSYRNKLAAMAAGDKKTLLDEQRSWLRLTRPLCEDAACLQRVYEVRQRWIDACGNGCFEAPEVYPKANFDYNLVRHRDPNGNNSVFNKDLEKQRLGRVAGCEALVEIAVGTAHGDSAFGAVCKVENGKERSVVMVCNDRMLGHFSMTKAQLGLPADQLVDFTIDRCFGG